VVCNGQGDANGDHCCFTPVSETGVCPLLEIETVPGRYYACGLRREAGSWEAVYQRDDYQAIWGDFRCGTFGPATAQCCFAGAA
jgi:hypothetical protein